MRILIYLLIIIAGYFLVKFVIRLIISRQLENFRNKKYQNKYGGGQIEDADYEEIKKDDK